MKIGIVTFHRAVNYGAAIQAWAFQKYLSDRGHNVQFLDYRKREIENQYKLWCFDKIFKIRSLKTFFNYVIMRSLNFKRIIRRNKNFERFNKSKLNITEDSIFQVSDIPKAFDILICGSDQIWNVELTNGFDDIYFLNFTGFDRCKKMAYAPSLEQDSFSEIDCNRDRIEKSLMGLDYISLRERNLIPLFQKYTNKTIVSVLDPSLLITKSEYGELHLNRKVKQPYIFLFHVVKSNKASALAKMFGKRKGLKVIELCASFKKFNFYNGRFQSCDPNDFISLLRYADFVVTTSFHGTTLSIVFEKNFYTIDTGNSNRQFELLKTLGLEKRFISDLSYVDMDNVIDYSIVNKALSVAREKSEHFLNNINESIMKSELTT